MHQELIKTAVVTGGHSFNIVHFTNLISNMKGVQPYMQHIDDFTSSSQKIRDGYDVVLFYIFMQDTPTDEGNPWWAGKPLTALTHLGESGQGLVILHHALLAYRGWSVWNDIVGVTDRGQGFHHGQKLWIQVQDTEHPITWHMDDWEMVDETYTMGDAGPGSTVLLTIDHPLSMRTLAWTRMYKQSRVFCFESGHDIKAYQNPNFQTVLTSGINWTAKRI